MLGVGWAVAVAKDLARHVAFKAADDLGLALSLGGVPLDVIKGGLVSAHANHDDPLAGGVGLSVAATVEPVPSGLGAMAGTG